MLGQMRSRHRGPSSPPSKAEMRAFAIIMPILFILMIVSIWQCRQETLRRQAEYDSMIAAGYAQKCESVCSSHTSTGAYMGDYPCDCHWVKEKQ